MKVGSTEIKVNNTYEFIPSVTICNHLSTCNTLIQDLHQTKLAQAPIGELVSACAKLIWSAPNGKAIQPWHDLFSQHYESVDMHSCAHWAHSPQNWESNGARMKRICSTASILLPKLGFVRKVIQQHCCCFVWSTNVRHKKWWRHQREKQLSWYHQALLKLKDILLRGLNKELVAPNKNK